MTLTKGQVREWNPRQLDDIGRAWRDAGGRIEELFDRYVAAVTDVGGTYWEGRTAEAAQERAAADRRTVVALVDRLDTLARRLEQGFHEVDAPLQRARATILDAEAQGFVVGEDLTVRDPAPDPDREAARAGLQAYLAEAVSTVENADRALQQELSAARALLRADFTSVAALGTDQGHADGARLVDGSVTPEALRRLLEAGALTPEQVDALRAGAAATIPSSHMEYLVALSRSLDGRTPREIADLMAGLPAGARSALANALQIVSTENVAVAVADGDIAPRGGADLLPDGIRAALDRDDLVVHGFRTIGGTTYTSTELNGVADNQAVAGIVAEGDAVYRSGSTLDRDLLDVGRRYLDAQVAFAQDPNRSFEFFTVDGRGTGDGALTAGILTAVADDRIAVEQAVTDPEHGTDFVRNVLVHDWSDDGAAVSSLFRADVKDGVVDDPHNAADVAAATRHGAIMAAVAGAMSSGEAWKTLSAIPETDGQSVGQLNPDLLRTVSHGLSPYIPDLAGSPQADRPGFDVGDWADPKDNSSYRGSANVFAAMNTDPEAGTHFTGSAFASVVAAETRYAQDPYTSGTTAELSTAGRILGLTDRGLMLSTQDDFHDETERQQAIYDRKSAAYDAVLALGAFGLEKFPGGEYIATLYEAGGDPLKELHIGPEPGTEESAELTGPNLVRQYYNVLAAAPEVPVPIRAHHRNLFDEAGRLEPYDEIVGSESDKEVRHAMLREAFNEYGNPTDGHETAMQEAYDTVVRTNG